MVFWNKKKEKTIEEKIAEFSYEQAREAFSLRSGEDVSLEELQARYAHWKDNSSGKSDHTWQLMNHAYSLLITPLSKAAWEQIPPSSITLKEAFKVFGMERDEKAQQLSSSDVPKQLTLNTDFGYRSRWFLSTIEDAQRLDAAYYALYQHAKPHQYAKNEPMEPPCSLRFQAIIARERAAGWDSPQDLNEKITEKEANAVFGIKDVGKFTPPEVTALFKDLQTRCTSVEEAQKLDEAYRWLFTVSCRYEKDFTVSIASPYAPVLAKKLGLSLSVVEIEPVKAEAPQEDVLEASALSEEPASLKKTSRPMATSFKEKESRMADYPYSRRPSYQKNQDYIESILPTPPELSKEEAQDKMLQHLINKFYHWRNQYCIRETDAEYLITPMTETWEELKKKREEFLTHRLNRNTFTEKVKDQTQIHEQEAPTKIPSRPLEVIRKDLADVQRNIAELDAERAYLEEKRARAIVGGTYVPKATEVSLDMTQKVARVFLKYQPSDIFTLEALDTRYKEVSEANDSKAIQEEIDVAYQVLKAHLEQKGEYQEERRKFDFGETETITVKELTYRYKLASEQTDSKAKQKALDEAYQLLLKTAI